METVSSTAPQAKLFKISGIGLATFFGSPLAGVWLMAQNFKRMGDLTNFSKTLKIGIPATLLFLLLCFMLPLPTALDRVVPLAGLLIVRQIAEAQQGKSIKAHQDAGGPMESNWKALAISIPIMLLVIAVIVGVAIAFPDPSQG